MRFFLWYNEIVFKNNAIINLYIGIPDCRSCVNNNFIMEVQNLRMQKNEEVRQLAKDRGVKLWEIAEKLGCADATLSRKLRRELPEAEKKAILDIIEAISAEQGE